MKQTIRLNESELRRIISESVRRVMNENLDDKMLIWDKRDKDEFSLVLRKIKKIFSTIFGNGQKNEYGFESTPLDWLIAEYSLDGNRKQIAKKVYSLLNDYDLLENGYKTLDSLVKQMLNLI